MGSFWTALLLLVAVLISCARPVAAFDFGDILAICLGVVVLILGLWAGIGWYARRKGLVV